MHLLEAAIQIDLSDCCKLTNAVAPAALSGRSIVRLPRPLAKATPGELQCQGLRGLCVNHEFKPGYTFDREVVRLRAFQNPVHEVPCAAILLGLSVE